MSYSYSFRIPKKHDKILTLKIKADPFFIIFNTGESLMLLSLM